MGAFVSEEPISISLLWFSLSPRWAAVFSSVLAEEGQRGPRDGAEECISAGSGLRAAG